MASILNSKIESLTRDRVTISWDTDFSSNDNFAIFYPAPYYAIGRDYSDLNPRDVPAVSYHHTATIQFTPNTPSGGSWASAIRLFSRQLDADGNVILFTAAWHTPAFSIPAPTISHITVTDRGAYSATIEYDTNFAGPTQMVYAEKLPGLLSGRAYVDNARVFHHVIHLDGLATGTEWWTSIRSAEPNGNVIQLDGDTFRTLNAGDTPKVPADVYVVARPNHKVIRWQPVTESVSGTPIYASYEIFATEKSNGKDARLIAQVPHFDVATPGKKNSVYVDFKQRDDIIYYSVVCVNCSDQGTPVPGPLNYTVPTNQFASQEWAECVFMLDHTTGWSSGTTEVEKTTDESNSWQYMFTFNSGTKAKAIHFVNASTGWLVRGGEKINRTTDGGASWGSPQNIYPSSGSTLNDIFMYDVNIGWAVGDGGAIYHTASGGEDTISPHAPGWAPQVSGTSRNLHAVEFSDANHGFIVGDHGTILYTSDGGVTWNAATPPAGFTKDLYSLSIGTDYTQSAIIIACGQSGKMIKTSNGDNGSGGDWVELTPGIPTYPLYSVSMAPGMMTGWVVGSYNTVLLTTDGGLTWISQVTPFTHAYNEWFSAYAVSEPGYAGNMVVIVGHEGGGDDKTYFIKGLRSMVPGVPGWLRSQPTEAKTDIGFTNMFDAVGEEFLKSPMKIEQGKMDSGGVGI